MISHVANRHEILKGMLSVLGSGSFMEEKPERTNGGYDHLLEHAFRMASKSERDRNAVLAADFLPTGKDIPALTGLSDLIGTE